MLKEHNAVIVLSEVEKFQSHVNFSGSCAPDDCLMSGSVLRHDVETVKALCSLSRRS